MRALAFAGGVALGCVGRVSPPAGASTDAGAPTSASLAATPVADAATPADAFTIPPYPLDPGRVTLHRLNRVEYNATVRDLLATTRAPADDFPVDDRGYGFDNIADVLTLSEVQMELYLGATETLVDEALRDPSPPSTAHQYEGEGLTGTVGAATGNAWNLWSNGELPVQFTPPYAGTYHVTVRAWEDAAGPADAAMELRLDGSVVRAFNVPNVAASPGEFTADVTFTSTAPVSVAAAFTNDYYVATPRADRNLYVDWIRIEGPVGPVGPPNPTRDAILVCTPTAGDVASEDACARRIVAAFGRRAWRRPLTDDEVAGLAGLLSTARAQGEGFETGIALAMQAMLLSHNFLFRVELDADPASWVTHPLTDHELASRLSYFLWSSMPDAALFAAADAGTLQQPDVLRAQVARMLADPKARSLTDNFAGQWLYTRSVADHDVDAATFPGFDPALRASFAAETGAYFGAFLRGEVAMDRFLTADFTYVDDALARYYGITAPGTGLRRASLAGSRRGGLLTQASLLLVNSHADRTSPVRRGQWVLNQLLCQPPPPPPPDVPPLPTETMPTGSLRQRFEAHRASPVCASCHAQMDPLGFAFEHFDAVGAWRDTDSGFAIDTTGTLPGTTRAFDGAAPLAALLAQDPRLPRCVAQQWFTYALGRGPEDYDTRTLDGLARDWSAAGLRLPDLVTGIVLSEAFTHRRGEIPGGH